MKRKLLVLVFMFLLAGLTVLVNMLAHRYNARADLTSARQHTLGQETLDLIGQIGGDIKITILHVGMAPKYLEDMLKEYERMGAGKITTKIVDPLIDLGYAAQFGNIITGDQKKAVVQSAHERRDVDFTDDVLTEELLTNAIIRVTRQKQKACFSTGHGEFTLDDSEDHGLAVFNKLLSTNNIDSFEVLLSASKILLEDCDVLIIAGPTTNLSEEEFKLIDDHLARGGDALVLVEHTVVTTPDKPLKKNELDLNPSLNELLNNWGLKINQDVVVDLTSHASGDVGSPATKNYLSHRAIVANLDYTFYIRPRSVSIEPNRRKSLKVAPIVLTQSPEESWGETDRTLNVKYDAGVDRTGPVPISFVVMEEKEGDETSDTRLIVFTDADFLTNAYIGAYSNAQMGLNLINWLTETDFKAFVNKKTFEIEKLDLLSHQKFRVRLILILMPVLVLLTGVGVWWAKR